jgi:hypothetical protein
MTQHKFLYTKHTHNVHGGLQARQVIPLHSPTSRTHTEGTETKSIDGQDDGCRGFPFSFKPPYIQLEMFRSPPHV